ncbi:hypothetical protein [Algoriphagus zhangzhouensis]|uniref:Uncharacterized protein n=1 Tax=Algoriphagus zhangzhouensis TaxID=1073327 RepID=A0A1M7ZEG0_9BACT|nr:hypothetical protein [Algoriphagus zhangzhouensis]TDY46053.1 hypothetical protein A8938_2660 [Algoriphagus zhangzhouensis]SHO63295.1 hypothetical protein SAMN04488108_2657 [Algoriphagus zhangzhouensis]
MKPIYSLFLLALLFACQPQRESQIEAKPEPSSTKPRTIVTTDGEIDDRGSSVLRIS